MAAFGLSLWDDGLAVCKAVKEGDNDKFLVTLQLIPAEEFGDATDSEVVARMLRASTLLRSVKVLVISYRPTDSEKLSYWSALYKALYPVYPTVSILQATQDERVAAASKAVGRELSAEALLSVVGSSSTVDIREALSYGSPLHKSYYTKQCSLMRNAAQEYLQSSKCSNSSTARQRYESILEQSYRPQTRWFVTDALWQAMHGVYYKEAMRSSRRLRAEQRRQQQQRRQEFRAAKERFQQERERRQQERQREQQRRQSEQRRQQQQQQRRAEQAAAGLSAAAPDVTRMGQHQLLQFLQQLGVAVSSSLTVQQLQSLAQNSLQLWEAKRITKCGKYISHQSSVTGKLNCAKMVFRLDTSSRSDSATVAMVKKVHKALALLVHPDKTPVGFEGFREVFEEGFKALRTAYDLLVK